MTQSTFARMIGDSPTDPAKIRRWRRDAWLEHETPILPLSEITNDYDRQVVRNIAEKMYGKRDLNEGTRR